MAKDPDKLILQLRSYATRSAAMQELVWMGADVVQALITALDNRSGAVRWAAIKCLGDIGDACAVPHLLEHLKNEEERGVTIETLSRITGNSFASPEEWKTWWLEKGEEQHTTAGERVPAPSDRELVEQAVVGLNVEIAERRGGFVITIPLEESEVRKVRISNTAHDPDGAELLIIYSNCGETKATHYEWALRRNMTMPYGSLGIHDRKDKSEFVMFNTLLKNSTTPLELRKSILTVAQRADAVEKALGAADKP